MDVGLGQVREAVPREKVDEFVARAWKVYTIIHFYRVYGMRLVPINLGGHPRSHDLDVSHMELGTENQNGFRQVMLKIVTL